MQVVQNPRTSRQTRTFAYLSLGVVVALLVAVSTVLAVARESNATTGWHAALATPSGVPNGNSVMSPLPALPSGAIVAGGASDPVTWSERQTPHATLRPIAGGADVQAAAGYHEHFPIPIYGNGNPIRVDADTAIVAGPMTNWIGLGCETADASLHYAFLLRSPDTWEIIEAHSGTVVADGYSDAIKPSGQGNHVSILCGMATGSHPQLMFAINGVTVANVAASDTTSSLWNSFVELCSCGGADTGRFTGIAEYKVAQSDVPAVVPRPNSGPVQTL
jgi:hypothetical protein